MIPDQGQMTDAIQTFSQYSKILLMINETVAQAAV
jgi:hypothetical protein